MNDIRSAFARQGLVRSRDDGILGGVCSGIGRRVGLTPWVSRLVFVLLLMALPGSQLLIYPVLWILMPFQERRRRRFRPRRTRPPEPRPASGKESRVKSVVYRQYGGPEVLRIEDVPTPCPPPGRCWSGSRRRRSTSATGSACAARRPTRGSAACARRRGRRSARTSPAWSTPSATGVTRFRPGDEVYGDNLALKGGFAEYAVAPESALAHKPAELSFAEASTIPQAGAIALQGTVGLRRVIAC